jgi:phytoene dehydrogenase-like protein
MKTQEIILIIKKKDISCKYFWDDGIKLNAYSDKSKFTKEIKKVLGVKEYIVSNYLLKAKRKYELTKSMFLEQSLHKLKTYLSKDLLIGLFNVFHSRLVKH